MTPASWTSPDGRLNRDVGLGRIQVEHYGGAEGRKSPSEGVKSGKTGEQPFG